MTSEVAAVTGDHQDVSQLKRTVEKLQDKISQLRNKMKTAREKRRRLQCICYQPFSSAGSKGPEVNCRIVFHNGKS